MLVQRKVSFFVNEEHWKTVDMNQGDLQEHIVVKSEQGTDVLFTYEVFRVPKLTKYGKKSHKDHVQYLAEDRGVTVTNGKLVDVWQQ